MNSPLNLLELPDDNKLKILERCDLKSILLLRQTCHSFRNFIDVKKPDKTVKKLRIMINSNLAEMSIKSENFYSYVTYRKKSYKEGCTVSGNGRLSGSKALFFQGQDYLDVFFKDFESILSHQKKVMKKLSMGTRLMTTDAVDRLCELLKNRNSYLQIEKLELDTKNDSEAIQLLQCVDLKCLNDFNLSFGGSSKFFMEKKNITIVGEFSMEKFSHCHKFQKFLQFTSFTVHVNSMDFDELVAFKKMLVQYPALKFIDFVCHARFFPMHRHKNIYRMENNGEDLVREVQEAEIWAILQAEQDASDEEMWRWIENHLNRLD